MNKQSQPISIGNSRNFQHHSSAKSGSARDTASRMLFCISPLEMKQDTSSPIAECKRFPIPILRAQARAQLKSYMSATNTRYGVLAVGMDPRHWEFCENKYNNWFASIDQETFERSVENWEPISVEASEVDLQRGRKAARWWKRIALAFALAFLISCVSVFLLWRKPPPEPVVYITRTGEKYHTHDCDFLRKYATEKFAILLDKAEKDYDPCRICSPHRTEKSR